MPRFDNLTDLWHGACDRMLHAPRNKVHMNGVTSFQFDKVYRAASMAYEFDLGTELWLTKSRFTSLKRDYLEPDRLDKFIAQSGVLPDRRVAVAQMIPRIKPERHHGKDWTSYKWGNCILGFTFRSTPTPHFTMQSRTTLITRMGGMDLALAYCLAREVAEERGENLEDYAFTWYIASVYHSSLHAIPYFYSHGHHETFDEIDLDRFPVMKAMHRQLDYNDRLDKEGRIIKHGTRERLRKQRRAFKAGNRQIAPPVSLDELDLDNLVRKR